MGDKLEGVGCRTWLETSGLMGSRSRLTDRNKHRRFLMTFLVRSIRIFWVVSIKLMTSMFFS